MKRVLIVLGLLAVGGAVCLTLSASRYESRIRPNVKIGPVEVGGLTREEAKKKLRVWWEGAKLLPLAASLDRGNAKSIQTTASRAGFTVDDDASVQELPLEDFWAAAERFLNRESPPLQALEVQLKPNGERPEALESLVAQNLGGFSPAKAVYKNGAISRTPEVNGAELDQDALPQSVLGALQGNGSLTIPIKEAPKHVPDSELERITEVVAEFSTKFPSSKISRNANIKLASEKLNGAIFMPGETFSFNQTVGRRTIEDGYRLAGVFKNGKHDVGIGGGICQVSGTLYNAALLSNLKIVQRHNHSLPVPYLPVGRDATVDYGSFDLQFENNTATPIAIASTYETGRLTFRILGVRDPNLEVKIVTSDHKSWGRGVQYVNDPSLPAGTEKVMDKGASGHSINTFRIVTRNGVEVERQLLSRSRYAGGPKIIAKNLKAKAPAANSDGTSTPQATPPAIGVRSGVP